LTAPLAVWVRALSLPTKIALVTDGFRPPVLSDLAATTASRAAGPAACQDGLAGAVVPWAAIWPEPSACCFVYVHCTFV
jgi:hypothetical protein